MRILVAPDKFKGSLGAAAVAENIAAGLRDALPEAEVTILPMADGGEGTAEVICAAAKGRWHTCEVHDALGHLVPARFATIDGGETAILETSEAIGLWRIPPERRALERASSFGAGEMILTATRAGAKRIIVGLGGSATNDGGYGMARALGFQFHAADSANLKDDVLDLLRLARIVPPAALKLPQIIVASDVRNPLLGERGATRTFAKQKGATAEQIERLELVLTRLADVASLMHGYDPREVPGAGAAGGLGFALMVFCGAEMRSGFEVVAEQVRLEDAVRLADVVITGEGRLDSQTLEGKAPAGVAKMAREHGKKVYAIVGQVAESVDDLFNGIYALAESPAEGEKRAAALLQERGREIGRRLSG